MVLSLLLLLTFGASIGATDPELERNELAAQRYVTDLEAEILARNNNATELSWAYESNITEEALKQRNEAASRNANFFKVRIAAVEVVEGEMAPQIDAASLYACH